MVEAIRQGDIPGVQLRCRQLLPLGREEAWGWLTEPDRLARWLADEVEGAPGEGESLLLRSPPEEARGGATRAAPAPAPATARVEEVRTVIWEPPRRWVAAFERRDAGWTSATRLVLELASRPRGCELSVLQDGFQNLPLSISLTVWEEYRRRWRGALARLAGIASPAAGA